LRHSKYIILFLTLGLVSFASGRSRSGNLENDNQVEVRLRNLAQSLADGNISKIELLQIPPDILTRTRITPELLEKQFYHKLTFQHVRSSTSCGKLITAMKTASVNPQTGEADLRWGILFYSDEGQRVGAIYLNARGTRGYVGDTSVSFTGGLFAWVDSAFSNWL
jgi:hypothetical protein